MSISRRKFTREFKLQILNEIAAGKSIAQAAREHNINGAMIHKWRHQYEKNPKGAFAGSGNISTYEAKIAELERMVGRLTMENDLLKKVLNRLGANGK